MKPFSLPRRDSLIGFLPAGYRSKKRSRTGRIVDQVRLSVRRIRAWSEGVDWVTIADFVFFVSFLLGFWAFYWVAYIVGWCD